MDLEIKGQAEAQIGLRPKDVGAGGFPFAYWSFKQGVFEAAVDLHGLAHLYYYDDGETFCAAYDLQQLVSLLPNPQLDYGALAVFYRMGTFIENDTPIKNVKVLGPAGRIVIRNGELKISERYFWSQSAVDETKETLIDKYQSLFEASIAQVKQTSSMPVSIPLSGGRDSRHIFLEALAQGLEIKQVVTSFFEPDNQFGEDVALAKQLCAKASVPVKVIKSDNNWFGREQYKNSKTSFGTMIHAWYVDLAKQLPEQSLLLDGLGGDVLSESKKWNSVIEKAFQQGDWDTLINHYLGFNDSCLAVFSPRFTEKISRNLAVERLLPVLKKYEKFHKPQGAFEFYCRARRNIALSPLTLTNCQAVYFPYLEKELFKFLSSVPARSFAANDFHTSVILKSYRDYADIAFKTKNVRAPYSIWDKLKYKYRKCATVCILTMGAQKSDCFNRSRVLPRLLISFLSPLKSGAEEWSAPKLVHLKGLLDLLKNTRNHI